MGHGRVATTTRYTHPARDTEKASAAKVGGSIGADIFEPDADAALRREDERDGEARETVDIEAHGRGAEGRQGHGVLGLRAHYIAQTRARSSGKRLTIGRHGLITPVEARRRTALIIAWIEPGKDPVPEPLGEKRPIGPPRRRARRAVSQGVRGGALQAEHHEGLPGMAEKRIVPFERHSPRKSRTALRPPTPGASSSLPPLGRKLFIDAQASISVPSTEKCVSDSSRRTRAPCCTG